MTRWAGVALAALLALTAYWHFSSRPGRVDFTGWATDTTRASVDFDELIPGCPERDCIPSIDDPAFTSVADGDGWLHARAPVAVVGQGDDVRAYPLQILTHHEIVNDVVGGEPLAVTYCPLWNTAVAFRRVVDGEAVEFGVSSLLRHRNLVMYDRTGESFWLQATGEGMVGRGTGQVLDMVPVPVMSWADFKAFAPTGRVLSPNTGAPYDYDLMQYAGYDPPPGLWERLWDLVTDDQTLKPMDRVVAMGAGGDGVAVPFDVLRTKPVVHTEVEGEEVVLFWAEGTASVLDLATVEESRDVGSVGVFIRRLGDQRLTFQDAGSRRFRDVETGSLWSLGGVALEGPLAGSRLEPVIYTNAFWFGWREFRPDTRVVRG